MSSITPPKKLTVHEQNKIKKERTLEIVKSPGMTMGLVGGIYCIMILFALIFVLVFQVIVPMASGDLEFNTEVNKDLPVAEREALKSEKTFDIAMDVGQIGVIFALFMLVLLCNALVMVGGIHLKNLTSYRWAMAGCIVCLVPVLSPGGILGIPLGIWGIMTITKKEVAKAFD